MRDRWVTVSTFRDSASAHIALVQLQAEEIDSFVADENVASWFPQYAPMRLRARASELAHARQVLARTIEMDEDAWRTQEGVDENGEPTCRACGSSDVKERGCLWMLACGTVSVIAVAIVVNIGIVRGIYGLTALAAIVIFLICKSGRVCRSCGNTWQDRGE